VIQRPEGDAPEVVEDALYGGRVRLRQLRGGHRAGTDAVLLAAALSPEPGEVVADIGAGTGAVGLMIAARSQARIVLVEKDAGLAALCRENVVLNRLEQRAHVIEADFLSAPSRPRADGLSSGMADAIVTNPPFFESGRTRAPPDPRRAAAHVMGEGGLGGWLRACADLLRPKGRIALIHRADRLDDCLAQLSAGFGGINLWAVHPRADDPAIRVVLAAVKGSRAPLTVRPPLVLHGADGGFTPQAQALHQGEGWVM